MNMRLRRDMNMTSRVHVSACLSVYLSVSVNQCVLRPPGPAVLRARHLRPPVLLHRHHHRAEPDLRRHHRHVRRPQERQTAEGGDPQELLLRLRYARREGRAARVVFK